MGMKIDEAILYMELYKRNLLDSVSDLDKDIEAYDTVIDIMRKYQKIQKIIKDWEDGRFNDDVGCLRVKVVLDGNDD